MNISSRFIANAQSAELVQPTQRTFDNPGCFAQVTAVRCALAGQAVGDTQASEPPVMSGIAVGTISSHDVRMLTLPTDFSSQNWNGGHQQAEPLAIVHRSAAQLNAQWNALGIGEKMLPTASFAAIPRVTTRLEPPETAPTQLESTTAHDQSVRSAAGNRRSTSWWSFSQTPAIWQSRSYRQLVTPLPHPGTCGKSSQAIPVFSTKRIPVSPARSQTRLRPRYICRRAFTGMSGWMIFHQESSINGFPVPRISPIFFGKYSHFVRRSKSKV